MPEGNTAVKLWIAKCTKEYEKRIADVENEIKTAGFFHKRDAMKHLKRLQKEFAEFKKNVYKRG